MTEEKRVELSSRSVQIFLRGAAKLAGLLAIGLTAAALLVGGVPFLGIFLGIVAALMWIHGGSSAGVISVEGSVLGIARAGGTAEKCSVGAVRNAVWVAGDGSGRLEMELPYGRVVEARAEEHDAAKLLQAMGWGGERQRARIRLARPGARFLVGGAISLLMLFVLGFADLLGSRAVGSLAVPAAVVGYVAAVWAALAVTRPPEVTVGLDGVEIRTAFGRRYLSFAEVEAVDLNGRGEVEMWLRGHRRLRLPGRLTQDDEMARALVRRVREGMAAGASDATAAEKLALFACCGRSAAAWNADIARTFARAGIYRRAPLSVGDAAEVLTAAGVRNEHRIGAALALAGSSEDDRARVRIAADACAGPRMRIALTQAADGALSDEALHAALAEEEAEASVDDCAVGGRVVNRRQVRSRRRRRAGARAAGAR